jgi:pimeloyl-ACP methyl ester carboxylesterase
MPRSPTPEAQADIYAAFLDTLQIDTVVMIGLSAGGASALQFAIRHPRRCRGLILISAISQPVPPLPAFLRSIYPFMLKSDFIPWLLYTIAPHLIFQANGVSRDLLARIEPDREKMQLLDALYWTTFPTNLRRDGMINDMKQLTAFPPLAIQQISIPTLVIHAVNDPIVPFQSGEYACRNIPHAQFLRLEDGGHFACITQRKQTIPAIHEFLDNIDVHA